MKDKSSVLEKFALSGSVAKDLVSPDNAEVIDRMNALIDIMAEKRIGSNWRSLDQAELFERLLPIASEVMEKIPGADKALVSWRETALKLTSSGGDG